MTLSPRQLPAARDALARFARVDPQTRELISPFDLPYKTKSTTAEILDAVATLQHAPLYYAAGVFAGIVEQAWQSLPNHPIQEWDLISPTGLIYFGGDPLSSGMVESDLGAPITCIGAIWSIFDRPTSNNPTGKPLLKVHCLTPREDVAASLRAAGKRIMSGAPPIMIEDRHYVAIGEPWDSDQHPDPVPPYVKLLITAFNIMRQPIIESTVERVPVELPKAARKSRKPSKARTAAIRVIDIRRAINPAASEAEQREYHHQWVVRGHWRMQPCGPGRAERRPTWIAPHVKGPEGAPLLGGEKVYTWVQ